MMNKKKNVVIVAGVFPPEPIVSANLLYELATELSKRYNVTVLRTKPTRPLGFTHPKIDESQWPFKVVKLDSYTCPESKIFGRFRESYSMGRKAMEYIKHHHKEIDFIYNDAWHLFGINIVARAAVKYGIKYITPVQDIYPESLISKLPRFGFIQNVITSMLLPIDRYNLSHAECIHTISDIMADTLARTRKISRNRFIVVRNWQDDRQFTEYLKKPQPISNPDTMTLMYLGNIGFLAGIETVIEAFHLIDNSNLRLTIAGSGAAKEMLIDLAKNDNRISFIDVPAGMVPAIQAMADIMVLPVKRGFALSSIPSKLPAYMFSGKPVLASVDPESDTAKCINHSNGGWIIEPESPTKLALQIQKCLEISKNDLSAIGQNGRKYALEHLSRNQNLSKLVEACCNVIEK